MIELLQYADNVVIALTSFSIGVTIGWSLRGSFSVKEKHIRHIVAVSMLGLYLMSVVAGIQIDSYETPILLHGIMGAIVGYLFSQGEGFNVNIGSDHQR
jgi:hypothetical protein